MGALLAEAQIEANDLHAPARRMSGYQLFLKEYPRSSLAEQARAGDGALADAASPRPAAATAGARTRDAMAGTHGGSAATGAGALVTQPASAPGADGAVADRQRGVNGMMGLPAPMATVYHRGPLAPVSGIRHWSTPDVHACGD